MRKKVVKRISELQEIKPRVYSALELHPKKPLLSRVGRKEQQRYYGAIQKQKIEFGKKLKEIDTYLGKVKGKRGDELKKPKIILPPKPKLVETRLKRYKKRRGY